MDADIRMIKTKEKIKLTDSLLDIMMKMSGGNPGALRVLMEILECDEGLLRILDLDNMGIYGSQIWVGYKNHCGSDIEKLIELIKNRDPLLQQLV